jgi:calcineurin-like phosphoesterase family protein
VEEAVTENLLLTSDWHLGHHNIRFLCNRPWDWPLRLIARHQEAYELNRSATLLHLGDVMFAKYNIRELREVWPGDAICTLGNHDRRKERQRIEDAGWLALPEFRIFRSPHEYHFCHRPQDLPEGRRNYVGVYGHKHNSPLTEYETAKNPRSIRLSPEFMDYRPIHLTDLLKIGETPIWHSASQRWYGASTYPEKLPVKEMGPNHRE